MLSRFESIEVQKISGVSSLQLGGVTRTEWTSGETVSGNNGVTGFGIDLSAPILFTGGLVVSGEGGISTRLTNLGDNISGIVISGDQTTNNYYSTNITGIGVNLDADSILTTGGFVVTGENGITVYLKGYGNNISGIVVSGTVYDGASGPGNVTGFGVDLQLPLFTGGLVVTGAGGVSATLVNLGNNISGIQISGEQTVNNYYSTNVTGFGVNLDAGTILTTGGLVVTGENGITAYLKGYGNNISGIVISGTVYENAGGAGNITGFGADLDGGSILYTGGMVITGQNGITTYVTSVGNNISGVIVSGSDVQSLYTIQHPFALSSGLIIDDGLTFSYSTYVDGLEGWVQMPGSGTGIVIDVQKNDETAGSLTIPSLSGRAEVSFNPILSFDAGDRYTFKVSQCPDDPFPGQNLRVRMHYHN